jgi:hypothetical protein
MLIRALVLVIPALLLFPAGDALAKEAKKQSLSDQSAKDQLKLQDAGNAFNRPAAAQRDLRDPLTNQDRIRSFRTRIH